MKAKFLIVGYSNYDENEGMYPVRICETYTAKEVDGYEVYKIEENGTIGNIVKSYDDYSEEGFVLCDFLPANELDGNVTFDDVKIIDKVICSSREEFIKTNKFKKWKKYILDSEDIDNYERNILCEGSFSEDYNENKKHWYVITRFYGKNISCPY